METEGITIHALSGEVVAVVQGVPETVAELKLAIEAECGVPVAQQQLVARDNLLEKDEDLSASVTVLTLIIDERPLSTWDMANNPDCKQLSAEGGHVKFAQASTDYVLVLTQAPIQAGRHYFEFHMHHIGDEQWCGVVTDQTRAGHGCGEAIYNYRRKDRKPGWFYYCGRRAMFNRVDAEEESADDATNAWKRGHDGWASLHAGGERNAVKLFKSVGNGDVIGMLVDADCSSLVFLCNGEVQGGCKVPEQPLYLSTCVDRLDDHVELRKLPVSQVPPQAIEALDGPLHPLTFGIPDDQGSSPAFSACSTTPTMSPAFLLLADDGHDDDCDGESTDDALQHACASALPCEAIGTDA